MIGLFAKLIGLGDLAKRVQKIFKKIRKRVDKVVRDLLKKAKRAGRKLIRMLSKGKKGSSKKIKEDIPKEIFELKSLNYIDLTGNPNLNQKTKKDLILLFDGVLLID